MFSWPCSGGLAPLASRLAFRALAAPLFVDLALFVLRPFEDMVAERYVRQASEVLKRVKPLVVAITGSYGKTTTKNYVSYLLAADRGVVASPRSFNNRAGLSRTVNEHLADGTEVLVAEMGAYGPGEIAAMCGWLQAGVSPSSPRSAPPISSASGPSSARSRQKQR